MELVKIGILVFSFIVCSDALAQEYIDLAKLDYAYAPESTFDNLTEGTKLHLINADLTYPIVINDKLNILTGASFENFSVSLDPGRTEESIYGITAKLGVNITHNEKWSGTYIFLPRISSDLENISSRDFQFGGIVLMKYIKSDNFSYKFGVYGNNELFGPLVVPIFGFYYLSPNKKFEANLLLPLSFDLNYSITEAARFGLNFRGEVRTYNINTPVNMESERYLEKTSNELYTYFQYELKKGINFQLGVGRSISRSFRLYDEDISFALPLNKIGDDRIELNTDFTDSWLFKATIFYRFKIEKTPTSN